MKNKVFIIFLELTFVLSADNFNNYTRLSDQINEAEVKKRNELLNINNLKTLDKLSYSKILAIAKEETITKTRICSTYPQLENIKQAIQKAQNGIRIWQKVTGLGSSYFISKPQEKKVSELLNDPVYIKALTDSYNDALCPKEKDQLNLMQKSQEMLNGWYAKSNKNSLEANAIHEHNELTNIVANIVNLSELQKTKRKWQLRGLLTVSTTLTLISCTAGLLYAHYTYKK